MIVVINIGKKKVYFSNTRFFNKSGIAPKSVEHWLFLEEKKEKKTCYCIHKSEIIHTVH